MEKIHNNRLPSKDNFSHEKSFKSSSNIKMDNKRPREYPGPSGYNKTHKVDQKTDNFSYKNTVKSSSKRKMKSHRIHETNFTDSKRQAVPKTNHPGLGGEYEVLLPACLALRFINNKEIKDFRLRSNVEGFGKFDDVLIDIKMENGSERHFALQLKHKENKNFKLKPDSFYTGDDFNLEKYCAAYYKMSSHEYHCVIYTNANFDPNKVKDVKNFKMISCEDDFAKVFLDTSDKNGNVYKFETNENTKKRQNFENFFQLFSLFVCQKNSTDLNKEIKNIFKTEYSAKDEKISTEYINLFRKWHNREFANDTLNRKILSIHLVDLLFGNFIAEPSKGTINRKNEKLGLLEESVRMFDVTIIEDSELKLVEELGKCEDKNRLPSYILEILEEYAKDFKTDKESLILRLAKEYKFIDKFTKELESDKKLRIFNYLLGKPLIINYSENSKHQISKVLEMDFKKNVCIKFVLVGKEIDSKQFGNVKSFNNLQDLFNSNKNLYQKVINEIDISLQGREKIKLEKIITSHEELSEMIQVKHLFQENLMFGEDLEKVPEYYIHRTVSVTILDENKVLKYFFKENYVIEKNDILMIDYGAEEDYVRRFTQDNSIEMINAKEFINGRKNINTIHRNFIIVTNDEVSVKQQFDQICSMTDKNINFLKINNPNEFLLIKSRNNHITGDLIKETESPFYFSKGVNVLCAEPGMGKTTTMKTIRNSCSSDYWTIFVELKQFNSLFKKSNLKIDEILDHFFKKIKEDAMSGEMRKIFLSKRKVALFLDGLDEVNYQNIDNVLEFIRKFKEEGFHVWVASRNNLREKIETELNQFSINIIEVNEEQQRQYITNRLRRDDKYSQDEINEIIKSIFKSVSIKNNSNILGIPLQLFMVTQSFIDNKEDNLELNDNLFVLTKLYTSYFEGKIKHELRKGGQTDKKYIERIAKSELKQYQILGLRSSLNDEDWEKLDLSQKELKESEEFVEEIEKKGDYYGIVENVNEDKTVIFVHHTHAEYFAAVYLSENFDKVRILGKSFLTEKYDNLRLLFDIKLAENNPLHLSIIYKDLDEFDGHIENFDSKDNGERTPLHVACFYATRYSSSIAPFEKETDSNMKMVDKLLELHFSLDQDKVFKWSCIEYASKYWCLYPLEAIFKKYNQVVYNYQNNENLIDIFLNEDNTSLAYYISCLGYNSLLTKLIDNNGSSLNELKYSRDWKCLLHCACAYGHNETVKLLIQNNANVGSVDENGDTPLHYACRNGHNETVKLLIGNDANVNSVNEYGKTLLHYACENGHNETAKLLIQNNVNVNSVSKYGSTPLHSACRKGHNEIAKLLIQNNANLDSVKTYDGTTPLHYACINRHTEIAKLLIQNNANVNSVDRNGNSPLYYAFKNGHDENAKLLIENNADMNIVNADGVTPLHWACENRYNETAKLLIENNANVNIVGRCGNTPLHLACRIGHNETAKLLIGNNADVNSVSLLGYTPLHCACANGHNETAKLLIHNNANVNIVDEDGDTSLHYAYANRHNETANLLIENNANVDGMNAISDTLLHYACKYEHKLLIKNDVLMIDNNKIGDTPLHLACRSGHNETAKLLIENNANVNSVNLLGYTPLHCACRNGHNETAKLLIQNNANVNSIDENSDTPLHYACANGHNETVKLLIENNANVDSVDENGDTPLHYACRNGHNETVKLLIGNDANVNSIDEDGNTPLHDACWNGYAETAKLLIENNADLNRINKNADTPLHYACWKGHDETAKLLIENNAEVNSVSRCGNTPLHYACRNGHNETAKLLIQNNADINTNNDKNGDTPLLLAERFCNDELIALLNSRTVFK